jgi:hypothetical protein
MLAGDTNISSSIFDLISLLLKVIRDKMSTSFTINKIAKHLPSFKTNQKDRDRREKEIARQRER